LIITLNKSDLSWCEKKADHIESLHLRSRKQSQRPERETNVEGIRAELAGAKALCLDKDAFESYKKASMEKHGSDRGRDIENSLTGLEKPIEIKLSAWKTEKTGFLFLRPPNRCGLVFDRLKHIDDSYFVLMYSDRSDLVNFEVLGWINAEKLRKIGRYNPIRRRPGQYETFGVHWSKLSPIEELMLNR